MIDIVGGSLPKAELLTKKMWGGDRIFLKALDEREGFFSLKFRYCDEELVENWGGTPRKLPLNR